VTGISSQFCLDHHNN